MDTNVYGAMNTTNAFLPLIKKKEQGKRQIFFVSSSMGSLTGEMSQVPFGITYSMSKAALNMYVVKLAAQFKDEGLTIVSTHPGACSCAVLPTSPPADGNFLPLPFLRSVSLLPPFFFSYPGYVK